MLNIPSFYFDKEKRPFWGQAYLYYMLFEILYNLFVFAFYFIFYGWTYPFRNTLIIILIYIILAPFILSYLFLFELKKLHLQAFAMFTGLLGYLFLQYNLLHLCNGFLSWLWHFNLDTWAQPYLLALKTLANSLWFDVIKTLLVIGSCYLLRLYVELKETEKKKQELVKLNQELQLGLIQQQLNPHFYFNTLNNLYGLAMTHSQKTAQGLAKLETLMHYILEDCNEEYVFLSKEIAFIQSYIELEKLRYSEKVKIDWQYKGNMEGKKMIPMLLIQLVENGFKHGLSDKDKQSWLEIHLEVKENWLFFSTKNSLSSSFSSPKGGIGLSSLKKRLTVLQENEYELLVKEKDNTFEVNLRLLLSA
ncbi:MAG: sensor histidine kinase [Bacteroidia bacterium]